LDQDNPTKFIDIKDLAAKLAECTTARPASDPSKIVPGASRRRTTVIR